MSSKNAFVTCHEEGCQNPAVERCNSCRELLCIEHINDHRFCVRIEKRKKVSYRPGFAPGEQGEIIR